MQKFGKEAKKPEIILMYLMDRNLIESEKKAFTKQNQNLFFYNITLDKEWKLMVQNIKN